MDAFRVFYFDNTPQDSVKATYPNPVYLAYNVDVTTDLGWVAAANAATHDVYFNSAADIPAAVTYEYDFLGRRIAKTAGGVRTEYVYDGDQVIAEYNSSGTLLRKFIYGPGIDEPICMIDVAGGGGIYYYHFNGLGSVVALSDNSGAIVERYEYDVYGQVQIMSSDFEIRDSSLYNNPYMFTGRRLDDETGLYYYRARMYHPELGRFIQPDPLEYYDGMNMYAYVGNNPLNWIDPSGTNIYLKEGNDSWNPLNNWLHWNIVVDVWDFRYDIQTRQSTYFCVGQRAYSFGVNPLSPLRWPIPGRTWLGHRSIKLPSFLAGEIYWSRYTGGNIAREKITTPQQDMAWDNYMMNRLWDKDVYSARHNCRKFCSMEFDNAPGCEKEDKK
ncbi:MAG TPA: hypothetical protein HPP87_08050 [Planctomycetes bacterium]|nr:hypothetical protein [Planctomycetota bacterium]